MAQELRSLKEGRTLPKGCDSENDEKDDIRPHAVNSVVRLETIYEGEPPECDGQNDEKDDIRPHAVNSVDIGNNKSGGRVSRM